MPEGLDLRRLEVPVIQAGMGGVSRHELAAARKITGRPIAVNLLLPFLRAGDAAQAAGADAIVTFWGEPRRLAKTTWIHQCGSVPEAKAAAAAGADAVIAQGLEAGGYVRGTVPLLELLERVRAAVEIPILAAGAIIDVDDVRAALDAGASAAVLGTRFLLSTESHAHPEYKRRCLEAGETVLTELFGLGWPDAPHRVIPNRATRRWLRADSRGPRWILVANRLTAPLARRTPSALQDRASTSRRASPPFLGPRPPTDDGPTSLVDWGPLYAGAGVARISDICPAADLVKALTP